MFDLKNKTEKKIKKSVINGYATTDEIVFVDDYHILTLGKAFTKNKTEYYSKYLVNLKSGKVEKEYFNTQIDINFNWTYMFNKNILTIENVGKIIQVISAVLDIKFSEGNLQIGRAHV